MCGILGVKGCRDLSQLEEITKKASVALLHRGPDDRGFTVVDDILLVHSRLAILDLSPLGHQPMLNNKGNLSIIFNGEIYNFKEIRKKLGDYQFKSNSDTEVLLAAYEKWGIDMLSHLNGMFAFAIYDSETKKLFIARDRLGIKPLYYYYKDKTFIFSSEIRAILSSGLVARKINKSVIKEYFTYQTVHAPNTMVKDVFELLPGQFMMVDEEGMQIKDYWKINESISHDAETQDYKTICGNVHDLLSKAVEKRLIADVPLGAFLSGGIDSSTIVGLMSKLSSQPVKTFTIVFDEEKYSEARYARIVAEKFKTDHHEFRLKPEDFLELLPDALKALDHPSGDGPNSYTVSGITRKNGLTVALSGLGGDELFAGYPVFKRSMKIEQLKWIWSLPRFLRNGTGALMESFSPGVSSQKARQILALREATLQWTFPVSRQVSGAKQLQHIINVDDDEQSDALQALLRGLLGGQNGKMPLLSKVSIAEISSYMQNVLLRDTDQMSMAHALEVRVPFLDHELVEYVLGIPDRFKNPTIPKKLLIDSIGDLLPNEIVYRKKMGFVFPWELWIRKDLFSLCDQNIKSLATRSFINGEELSTRWEAFQKNDKNVRWLDIWIAVVLEHWISENDLDA